MSGRSALLARIGVFTERNRRFDLVTVLGSCGGEEREALSRSLEPEDEQEEKGATGNRENQSQLARLRGFLGAQLRQQQGMIMMRTGIKPHSTSS